MIVYNGLTPKEKIKSWLVYSNSKIFVENYLKLLQAHQGPFHKAPSLKNAYLTDMLQELIDLGYSVYPIIVSGKWCEIDTPQDLERARKLFS